MVKSKITRALVEVDMMPASAASIRNQIEIEIERRLWDEAFH
jgi:hypothetical protein